MKKKFDHDKFIGWIQEQMLSVTPHSFKRLGYIPKDKENRQTLYEITCNKACLNSKSADVLKAFDDLYPL